MNIHVHIYMSLWVIWGYERGKYLQTNISLLMLYLIERLHLRSYISLRIYILYISYEYTCISKAIFHCEAIPHWGFISRGCISLRRYISLRFLSQKLYLTEKVYLIEVVSQKLFHRGIIFHWDVISELSVYLTGKLYLLELLLYFTERKYLTSSDLQCTHVRDNSHSQAYKFSQKDII